MTYKTVTCPVCQSKKLDLFHTCSDYFVSGEKFNLLKCSDCSFVITDSVPENENIGKYYQSEEYISHSDTQTGLVNQLYHTVRNVMLKRKWKLVKGLSSGKNLLDIGCGTGYFLNYIKDKGYNTVGMEPDSKARSFAKEKFGLVVNDPITMLNEKHSGKFNVITLWHVLEHLHDLNKYLNWIYDSLEEKGVLILALPNCSSYDAKKFGKYWAAYDVPRHIWHFAPATLEKLMKSYKFSLRKIKRMPFDAYYNSMLSAKYAKKHPAIVHGFFTGLLSNIKSFFKHKYCSSIIYILTKE